LTAPFPGRHIRQPVLAVLFCPISIFCPVLPNLRKRKEFRPEAESASTKSKNAHAQLCLLMITTFIQLVSITRSLSHWDIIISSFSNAVIRPTSKIDQHWPAGGGVQRDQQGTGGDEGAQRPAQLQGGQHMQPFLHYRVPAGGTAFSSCKDWDTGLLHEMFRGLFRPVWIG
jgi:hypothetical protein